MNQHYRARLRKIAAAERRRDADPPNRLSA
jgi:hypothetical protein